jgi:hypothetical protein
MWSLERRGESFAGLSSDVGGAAAAGLGAGLRELAC